MTEKKDDFSPWAILLGMAGAAIAGLLAFGNNNKSQSVNSYQSTSSYSQPTPPTTGGGGCGCSAGR